MSRLFLPAFLLYLGLKSQNAFSQLPKLLTASNHKVKLDCTIDSAGVVRYAVSFDGRPVVEPSRLGFKLANSIPLDSNFMVLFTDATSVNDAWKPVWREVGFIHNQYNQLTVHLLHNGPSKILFNIVFKVFEDGVAFRHEFPLQALMVL